MWTKYCKRLMNIDNERDRGVDYVLVEGPWEKVTEKEVWEALKRMKKGKSSSRERCQVRCFRMICM